MDTSSIAKGRQGKLKFKDHSEVAQLLNSLHDYYNLSWPKIAQLPALNKPHEEQIPPSTLAKIAKTEIVPKKWRDRFPGITAIDDRPRIAISKNNMYSAFKTITNPDNIKPEHALELTRLLKEYHDSLPWRQSR